MQTHLIWHVSNKNAFPYDFKDLILRQWVLSTLHKAISFYISPVRQPRQKSNTFFKKAGMMTMSDHGF